jgi:cytochrome c5
MNNVIAIHAEVLPLPAVVLADEQLRRMYWKGAQSYWSAAKEARLSGQLELASTILASARQALAIATAADTKAMLQRIANEERQEAEAAEGRELCFTECHGTPIQGTPAPLLCPFCFCGDPCTINIVTACEPDEENAGSYYAECASCSAQGPSGATQMDAALAWNNREAAVREATS